MTHSISHTIFNKFTGTRVLSLILFLAFGLGTFSQLNAQVTADRAKLEREKTAIQKRLREFDTVLKKTTDEKKVSVSELRAVNQKLVEREKFIATINKELQLVNKEINQTSSQIKKLNDELNLLKEEYAKMIYTSYKLNQGVNLITFIFSSATFKQFYMRLKYLKQYSDARKKQVEQMEKVSLELAEKQGTLELQKQDQIKVLKQEQEQKKVLDQLKMEQQRMVNTLSQKEEEVKKEIAATKKQQAELNQLIKNVIAEEIKLAKAAEKAEEKPKSAQPKTKKLPNTPQVKKLSASFASNKGNIPWPVDSGFISKKYGTYPHPTLKGISETNDGIDIQTTNNAPVKSVFPGTVTKITTVPGMGGTIIIKHGDFYTMYSRLKTIDVKSGEEVQSATVIGHVYSDEDGYSELHFQTWKGLEVMNPSIWLSSK
ncbi:murein hydrolase activator EnvC family protein [Cyclobacterium amurskyense]|uniref:Putative membrane protein n=1 Tax=Cyclobacterium amurskyense TaxID=320787 RepID=A0A0H4PAR4_9BACT|nr:peptidoglycan DD-metalloendopeptidase family protein [Cyclobacterium amurskyense]AKP49853.1 Putative membrane protein [Cyclobacterium amurskyense]|tara:strand:- start:79373 stop:80659 length:1287 start_codon:yes stop_codon:yes gene_type:complete